MPWNEHLRFLNTDSVCVLIGILILACVQNWNSPISSRGSNVVPQGNDQMNETDFKDAFHLLLQEMKMSAVFIWNET